MAKTLDKSRPYTTNWSHRGYAYEQEWPVSVDQKTGKVSTVTVLFNENEDEYEEINGKIVIIKDKEAKEKGAK